MLTLEESWKSKKLRELPVQIIDGDRSAKYPKRSEFRESGVLFLNTTNIVDDRLDLDGAVFVGEEKFAEIKKGRAQRGDIFMTTRGSIGKVALFDCDHETALINAQMLILRPDPTQLDSRFLFHTFRSPLFKTSIGNFASGSAQPQIPITDLREVELLVPSLAIQCRIADILSAYDDLIENNQRRIKILEKMARSLYREWFVHFRFPGHGKVKMVSSPLGSIPQGWEIGPLGDLVQFKSGFAFKSGTFSTDGEYRLVTIRNVQDGSFNPECDSRINVPPDNLPPHCILEGGDILLSLTGNVGRVCLVYDGPFFLNQRVAKLVPTESTDRALTYCMFRATPMRVKLEQLSTGVAQQNLSPVLASKIEVAIPTRELRERFSDLAEAMIKRMVQLYLTNSNLRRTRDMLLPRLLSGQVNVA